MLRFVANRLGGRRRRIGALMLDLLFEPPAAVAERLTTQGTDKAVRDLARATLYVHCWRRRVSYERMAELYRRVHQLSLPMDRPVKPDDIRGLNAGDSFAEFLDRNSGRLQYYEEGRISA